MAALNTIAKEWADEIREGIAWVIIWKTGRSWNAEAVWLNPDDDTFELEDLDTARTALEQDPNAVMLNGYYCGHFGENMTVAELAAGIRWHYENKYNQLQDSTAFPSEPLPRPEDLPADIPWHGKATSAEPDPYIFDGYMSAEDYEHMHELMAADRQQDAEAACPETPQAREVFQSSPRPVSGEIYLDGKPIQFAEATLPDISVGDLSGVPPSNALDLESVELTFSATPQTIETTVEAMRSMFAAIVQNAKAAFAQIARVFKKAAITLSNMARKAMDTLLYAANDNPKWWHLYKHAKKARVRKKYRRRLVQQLFDKLRVPLSIPEVIT